MPELYSQVLDLKDKDVFLETEVNDTRYFSVTGLPPTLSYGKHPFALTFNDPEGQPLLKNLSNIIFEFVDSRGTVIFTDIIDIEELSGAGNGFVWIKKDPLRTSDEIADGPAYFYVMGELEGNGIPNQWKGLYNVRSTFEYDIRKDYPNTSNLILKNSLGIQTNLNISESIEFDSADSVFKRSFINVSLTDLETNGGKIDSIELAYNEQKARTDEYEIITRYPIVSGSYETDDQTAISGLNPITNTTKIITPKQFRRNTPVRFRLRFVNPAGQLAQYLDENRQGEIVEVTSSFITFEGSPHILERDDNLLSGSMYTGNAVGKGFEQSGKSSAYLKTVDYEGFVSASVGSGSAGIMFFSGSVLPSSGDNYGGVGLELHGGKGSGSFRFRTNPSLLEIQANTFFVGSENTQFISGSGGQIEISSSDFHLTPQGQVTASAILLGSKTDGQFLQFVDGALTVQGSITADSIRTPSSIGGAPSTDQNASSSISSQGFATFKSASIGGFIINPSQIKSTDSSLILNSDGKITGSAVLFGDKTAGQFVQFSDNTLTVQGDITANNIRTPATIGGSPSTDANASASINTQGFAKFVSASIGGFDVGTGGFTLGGSNVNIDSTNKVISINDSTFGNTGIQLDFNSGTPRAFIGKAGGEFIKFDGSAVNISSSAFFIGGGGQFISGANQNIEISSSAFHLDPRNNILVISGTINAGAGNIGDFQIIDGKISGSNITFDANRSQIYKTDQGPGSDTSAAFNQLRDEYYIDFTPSSSNDPNGTDYYIKMGANFMVDKSGILIASGGLFEGTISASAGSIGGFLIESSSIRSKGGTTFISGSPSNSDFFIKSPNFNIKGSGDVTGSSVLFTGGKIGGLTIDTNEVKVGTVLRLKDSGQITGSNVLFSGGKIAGFDISGTKLQQGTSFHLDGDSSADFFISSSKFQVTPNGDITGSSALFDGNTTIGGTLTVNGTGEIAGFGLTSNAISSSNDNLILKSSGQITGSEVLFTGGKIADFSITSTQISDSDGDLILKSNGQITASAANIIGTVTSTAGAIGGFNITDTAIKSTNNAVELSSALAGLLIKDGGGTNRVLVKSGSLGTVGGGTQYIGNKSFEDDTISAGRNFVSNITSWSFSMGGNASASLTDRSSFADDDKAVSGDVTFDIFVPDGSDNYSGNNTYEISQVITASIAQGDTISFSSVARFSSSFGGRGKDRALGPQYFRLEYSGSDTNGFVPFLPEANFTASNGYGEYFLGSGQYSSFGASADLPSAASFIKVVVTGSINDDTGFSIEKPLFAGDKGTVNSDLKGRKFTKQVVGSTTAEFPETEITFDNFSVRSNTRRVELTEDGLLIYNSEDSFIKMSGAGIEIRGGSGVASFGSSINRESFTNDSQVAGTLGAPSLQAYTADPEDIGTTASDGNVAEFAKGNHVHRLTFSTINSILNGNTVTNGTWNSGFGSTAGTLISGSFTAPSSSFSTRITTLEGQDIDDDLNFAGDSGTGTIDLDTETFTIAGGNGLSSVASGNSVTLNMITGILSSSAQISDDISGSLGTNATLIRGLTSAKISGSFTAPSSSFSTRVTNLKTDSGSFSTRITTLEGQDIDDDLNFAGDSGTGTIDLDTETLTIAGGAGMSSVASGNSVTLNLDTGILSSSAQISTQISGSLGTNASFIRGLTSTSVSGSFTAPSSSFSTRVTNLETDSGSFSSRLTTAESELSNTLISSSAQIADEISGSFTAASSSFSSRVTTLEGLDTDDDLTVAGDTGGNLSIDLDSETLTIAGGTGIDTSGDTNTITVTTNDSEIVHDNLSGFVANEHIDHSTVSVIAGDGLTGGGTIAANRTLNIGAGTGIDVAADAISVDVSDFMTNGSDNRIVTATGTDAMNAEANLTFDGSTLNVVGNVSGSSTSTGSFGAIGIGTAPSDYKLNVEGTVRISGLRFYHNVNNPQYIWNSGALSFRYGYPGSSSTVLMLRSTRLESALEHRFDDKIIVSGDITGSGNLEIAGNISGSATSTGSFGRVEASNISGTNTGDVTLAGSYDYITISNQVITRNQVNLTTDVTGTLPVANGGIGATSLNNLITLGTHTTGNYVASLVAGTGIDLANNSGETATPTVSVDVSDFMTNGSNNRVLTATGTDAMNAEANLIFDGTNLLAGGITSANGIGLVTPIVQVEGTTANSALSIVRNSNSISPPYLMLGKSRGTSLGSDAIVQNGDVLGAIRFNGADGTDRNSYAAEITAEVDGAPGSNDMPGRLIFETTSDGASTSTERMRIDSSGNVIFQSDNAKISGSATSTGSFGAVSINGSPNIHGDSDGIGLGITNPAKDFHIHGSTPTVRLTAGGFTSGVDFLMDTGGTGYIGNRNNGKIQIFTNGTATVDFLANQNTFFYGNISGSSTSTGSFGHGFIDNKLGIGTTSPVEALHVAGKAYVRRTGTATAHGDTDLFVADSTAGGSYGQIQILGGASGASLLYFSDTNSYSVGGIKYFHSDNRMTFRANDTDILDITSTKISGSSSSTGSFGGIRSAGLPLFVNSDKVGIGTTAPYYKAHISFDNSTTAFSGGSSGNWGGNGLRIENTNSTVDTKATLQLRAYDYDALISAVKKSGANEGEVQFIVDNHPNLNEILTLTKTKVSGSAISTGSFGAGYIDNKLGIGTSSPSYELHTTGDTFTTEKFLILQNKLIQSRNSVGAGNFGNSIKLKNSSTGNMEFTLENDAYDFTFTNGKVGIGTTTPTEKLYVAGNIFATGNISGSVTSTGSFADGRFVGKVAIGTTSSPTTDLAIGGASYTGGGLYVAAGSSNRVALLGNIEITTGTGGSWSGQSINAEGSNRTLSFKAGGNLNASDSSAFLFTGTPGNARTVDQNTFEIVGGYGNNTLKADYSFMKIGGTVNQTNAAQSGSVIGIEYDPSFTLAPTGSHTAFLATSGDIVSRGTNAVISGSSTSTGSFGRVETAGAIQADSLLIESSTGGINVVDTDSNLKSVLLAGNSLGTVGTYSNHPFHIRTNTTNAIIIDTSQNSTFSGNIISTKANGLISGSSTSTGSFGLVLQNGQTLAVGQSVGTTDDVTFGSVTINGTSPLLSFDDTNENGEARISGNTGHVSIQADYNNVAPGSRIDFEIDGTHQARLYGPTGDLTLLEGGLVTAGNVSGSSTSTGSFGRVHVADKLGIQTTTPRGSIDVKGSTGTQGFYLSSAGTAVYLPSDIIHSGGSSNFDIQPRLYRLGTSTGGPVTIHPKYDSMLKLGTSDDTDLLVLSGSTKISGSAISTGSFGSLVVADAVQGRTTFKDGSSHQIYVDANVSGVAEIGTDTYSPLRIKVNNNQAIYISQGAVVSMGTTNVGNLTSTGNILSTGANALISGSSTSTGSFGRGHFASDLGIGTTSPSALIHGTGTNGTTLRLKNTSSALNYIHLENNANTGNFIQTNAGSIALNADAFGSSGDVRLMTGNSIRFKIDSSGHALPGADDTYNLGSSSTRWADVFAVQTTTGGVFETGLRTEKIGDNPTGTIVSWREDGLVPCDSNEDELVMGVIKEGKDEPIVMGAEPVLVTGKVEVGDYIVTSDKIGHGKSVKRGYLLKKDLFGKVIAQALESCDGDSNLIKCMIRKM